MIYPNPQSFSLHLLLFSYSFPKRTFAMLFKRAHLSDTIINRSFALLWTGQTISVLGDASFDATLALWIGSIIARGQSWAPLAFSGVYLAATLPSLFIGPFAGVFVDRWNKRHIMLAMDASRTLLVILLMFISGTLPLPFLSPHTLSIPLQLSAIYLIVALSSICSQFFGLAQSALLVDIVPEHLRTRATAQSQASFSLAWIFGPSLGALTLTSLGIHWAILLNAVSFACSFLCILAIHPPSPSSLAISSPAAPERAISESNAQLNFRKEFSAGLRFTLTNSTLSALIIAGLLFTFGVGILNTLYLFFCTENLHIPPSQYGLFVALPALGSALGAVLLSRIAPRLGEGRTLWLSLLFWGCVVLLLSRQQQIWPAVLLLFLVGIGNAGLGSTVNPLIMHVTPRPMIGRVFAIVMPSTIAAASLAIALTGLLSTTPLHQFHVTLLGLHFAFIDTMYSFTGLLSLAASLYIYSTIRHLRCSPHA
jgi:MFS family permease